MSYPKYVPYRNPKILKLAKDQACTCCGKDDGTVVAAHQNGHESGKGMGIKGDDFRCAYLCADCHYAYDSYKGIFSNPTQRELNINKCILRTQKVWIPILLPMRDK